MATKPKRLVKSARKPASKPTARKRTVATRLSVRVDRTLLKQVDAYARAHRTTVADLVAEGLRKVIGTTKAPVLPSGDMEAQLTEANGPWAQLLAWMEEQQSTLTEIRNALGDVAASLPNDTPPLPPGGNRPAPGPRIPPP